MVGNFLGIPKEKAEELRQNEDLVAEYIYSDAVQDSPDLVYVDKAWHAVHFLLTGSAWEGEPPLSKVVMGGTPLGEDAGYGPARLLEVGEVRIIADALKEVPASLLRERFSPESMAEAEIYPPGLSAADVDYVVGAYQQIVEFYSNCADRGHAALLFLS